MDSTATAPSTEKPTTTRSPAEKHATTKKDAEQGQQSVFAPDTERDTEVLSLGKGDILQLEHTDPVLDAKMHLINDAIGIYSLPCHIPSPLLPPNTHDKMKSASRPTTPSSSSSTASGTPSTA